VYSAEKPWYAHFLWKALEDGKIPSLDQKVNLWEPRLNDINADLGHKDCNITWRHLANQTSCYGVRDNPGEAFNYNDYQMALFWDTLFLKVYGATYENVDSTLLHPMLTDILQCQDAPTFIESGHSSRGSLGISVRDFARFGLLYLRKGNWKGRQLISAKHATMAVTSPLPVTLPDSVEELAEVISGQRTIGRVARVQKQGSHRGSYSWLWWTNGVDRKGERFYLDAPADLYGAFGKHGNVMAVIPSLDLIVSWSSRNTETIATRNEAFKRLLNGAQSGIEAQGDRFFLNGRPFDMWGIRTASATMNQATTDHLIAQLDDYKAHGVNTVTVFYMGSSGGNYDPFSSDGRSINSGHQSRMKHIIEACAARNMVLIVGVFYQHAPFGLRDAEAVRNLVRAVTMSLKPYRNIILNIANEQNSRGWEDSGQIYDFRNTSNIIELCRIVHQEDPDRLVGGGGYDHDKNEIIGISSDVDVLLFDTVGEEDSGALYNRFVSAGVTGKPIVNVELFGSWSRNSVKGVYSSSKKQEYYNEIDGAAAHCGLSVFFHSNTWCQEPPIRYDLAGQGTSGDPGIRWYFDCVLQKLRTSQTERETRKISSGSISYSTGKRTVE
jgi:CubicO group peptidase (beta-lactamase class C family)